MKLVGFLCNWCSYEASMGAAGRRLAVPSDIVFLRVMCSGMVQPQAVLWAFAQGADGVLILGCHPGSCHYVDGNLQTQRRVELLRELLKGRGIAPERLGLDWAAASEGDRFAMLVDAFRAQIAALGPLRSPTAPTPGPEMPSTKEKA